MFLLEYRNMTGKIKSNIFSPEQLGAPEILQDGPIRMSRFRRESAPWSSNQLRDNVPGSDTIDIKENSQKSQNKERSNT